MVFLAIAVACSRPQREPEAGLPAARRILRVPAQYGTVQAAVVEAQSGDRILVSPGSYRGAVMISGPAKDSIQIVADADDGQVILAGDHRQQTTDTCRFAVEPLCPERAGFFLRDVSGVIIRGFTVRDFGIGPASGIGEGFLLVNAHRNRIERNEVTRTDMMGVTLLNSSHNVVEGNTFYGNDPDVPGRVGTGCGVHIQNSASLSPGAAAENIIRDNVVYGNPFAAVMLRRAGRGNRIVDNEFRDGGAWGVTNRGTDGTIVEGNRVMNHTGFKLPGKPRPEGAGVGIDVATSNGVVVRNNSVQNNITFDIEWDGAGDNSFTGNRCAKGSRAGVCAP